MVKVKTASGSFIASYDDMGSLQIWKPSTFKRRKEADWYIQDTEDLPKDEEAAVKYLESGGYFPKTRHRKGWHGERRRHAIAARRRR